MRMFKSRTPRTTWSSRASSRCNNCNFWNRTKMPYCKWHTRFRANILREWREGRPRRGTCREQWPVLIRKPSSLRIWFSRQFREKRPRSCGSSRGFGGRYRKDRRLASIVRSTLQNWDNPATWGLTTPRQIRGRKLWRRLCQKERL